MSPLPPPGSNPLENTNWRDLYRTALLELEPTKLCQWVAEAESAVTARVNELFQGGDDSSDRCCSMISLSSVLASPSSRV